MRQVCAAEPKTEAHVVGDFLQARTPHRKTKPDFAIEPAVLSLVVLARYGFGRGVSEWLLNGVSPNPSTKAAGLGCEGSCEGLAALAK